MSSNQILWCNVPIPDVCVLSIRAPHDVIILLMFVTPYPLTRVGAGRAHGTQLLDGTDNVGRDNSSTECIGYSALVLPIVRS